MKKVRGQRKKLNRLLNNIERIAPYKNTDCIYEHFHVPDGQWIESTKTSGKIKTIFAKKWLEKGLQVYNNKPNDLPFCKVVVLLDEPFFWSSQIIIFYDKYYYDNFFDRKGSYQIWTPIEKAASFLSQRNIDCPLKEKGYEEVIYDEKIVRSKIWFYGDVE